MEFLIAKPFLRRLFSSSSGSERLGVCGVCGWVASVFLGKRSPETFLLACLFSLKKCGLSLTGLSFFWSIFLGLLKQILVELTTPNVQLVFEATSG